ncbi:hypothetical protein H310_03344 [Aphanomyces invadans]|uniref:LsmAD domain-containing protein n=1 Tax=Aphanomyces invadans TaxID=157072 RepID=A0A024UGQ5_9STRA|nr:hypothetical protein H310_03344 [Aphanomyces invadans]ETW05606.1 hypothetical protein H310_03344 [Aphanomyces invadans]|eukprot:XP_008865383.1 hypothetical protein H310_03344 [Aphanomyces invadans]
METNLSMTRHDDNASNGSDSSDSDDDFLRLAPEAARRKAGLTKATSLRGGGEPSSIAERNTASIEKAARKTTFVVAGQTAAQRRLDATKEALHAKARSLALNATHHTRSIFDLPAHGDSDVNLPELSFQFAPSHVQELYEEGYTHAARKHWKPAVEAWEKIVVMDAAHPGKAGAAILDWLLPLHAHMAIAYKKLGLLRRALVSYGRVRQAIEAAVDIPDANRVGQALTPLPNRHDFIADALHQMSKIYHELGDIESALHCTDKANALLLEFLSACSDSPEETERIRTLHRDRLLAKMLKDTASGDFGPVDDLLATLENYESSDVTLEHLGHFIDPTTGATFVMAAAGCGHMPLLTKLCKEGLRAKAHLEVQDACGNTALSWACKFGQVLAIQFLLDEGASFQALHTDELKTWPKSSLQALHEHIQARKREKKEVTPAPPAPKTVKVVHVPLPPPLPTSPPPQKKPLYQPLVPVVTDKSTKGGPTAQGKRTSAATRTANPDASTKPTPAQPSSRFNAAPPSAAAASGELIGRALQAWCPESEDGDDGCALENESSKTGSTKKWDQFEANRRLFGVESAFDENLYTTARPCGTADQELAAATLAAEIEGKRSVFKHVNEERGVDDDEDHDPEAKYGAVLGSGAYGQRAAESTDGFTDRGVLSKRHK